MPDVAASPNAPAANPAPPATAPTTVPGPGQAPNATAPGDVFTLLRTVATAMPGLIVTALGTGATAAAAQVAPAKAPGNPVAVTTAAATPGNTPPPPWALSADEREVIKSLMQTSNRHLNKYVTGDSPDYRGITYLTNVVWYMRTVLNPDKRELTADELKTLKKAYGGSNIRVPASGGVEIPNSGAKGWPRDWNAIYFGGVIPFMQEALQEIRVPDFADIAPVGGLYTSTSTERSYRAREYGDKDNPAKEKNDLADSRRLLTMVIGKESLGTEYAQNHPEPTSGAEFARPATLDCSGFVNKVFTDRRLEFLTNANGVTAFGLGSQVSDHYSTAIRHPEKFRIVHGYRCKQVGSGVIDDRPVIEEQVDEVELSGPVLTGDIAITGLEKEPHRSGSGALACSFKHIVILTGRKVGGKHECIHASDRGEGLDLGAKALSDIVILMRPLF